MFLVRKFPPSRRFARDFTLLQQTIGKDDANAYADDNDNEEEDDPDGDDKDDKDEEEEDDPDGGGEDHSLLPSPLPRPWVAAAFTTLIYHSHLRSTHLHNDDDAHDDHDYDDDYDYDGDDDDNASPRSAHNDEDGN